jgi:hypothetical protein
MNTEDRLRAWGYDPAPGEAPDTGTLEVHDGTDRWLVTYEMTNGEVIVELIDCGTDPLTVAGEWVGIVGDLRPFIEAAYRKAAEA